MIATNAMGVSIALFEAAPNVMRDECGVLYTLVRRTGTQEFWDRQRAPASRLYSIDDMRRVFDPRHERFVTERCDCEGPNDPAPGAAIFDGDDVQRCDSCARFEDDIAACRAYVAGLNRAVAHLAPPWAPVFVAKIGRRCRVALPRLGPADRHGKPPAPFALSELALHRTMRRLGVPMNLIVSTPSSFCFAEANRR